MDALVHTEQAAVDRLAELDLSREVIERAIQRADADSSMCTSLDPPIMPGLIRWGRTNRYLREELAPAGWQSTNPRNVPRTIHPGGEFAVVATTGDDATGIADRTPSTKYPKGFATASAVEINGQLPFDFGDFDDFDSGGSEGGQDDQLLTWLLLFHADETSFRAEVSLPDGMLASRICSWAERIILPSIPRAADPLPGVPAPDPDAYPEPIDVAVERR